VHEATALARGGEAASACVSKAAAARGSKAAEARSGEAATACTSEAAEARSGELGGSDKLMFGIFRPNAHLMFVVSVASGRYSAPKSPCNNQKDNIHFIGTAASKVRLALQASIPDSLSAIALQVAAAKVRLAVLSVLATVATVRAVKGNSTCARREWQLTRPSSSASLPPAKWRTPPRRSPCSRSPPLVG
jgi:hypothetical protein